MMYFLFFFFFTLNAFLNSKGQTNKHVKGSLRVHHREESTCVEAHRRELALLVFTGRSWLLFRW